ncbi:MAG: hypothetical protein KJO92_09285, partial [Gammaproteobacteria bacterium]|nr:hypothetical protein [Gammaproteobacteria bacterium]
VANILHSADFRVANSIAVPPEPCAPPDPCNNPDLNGAVNRVEAIGNQVSSADDMVKAMIEEVMGFEPMPFRAEDLIPPLEVVRDAAGGMVARVGIFLRTSPDSAPEYIEALETVGNKASDIIDTAQDGIEYLGGAMECSAYETADACNAMPGCVWIIDAAVEFCHIDEY